MAAGSGLPPPCERSSPCDAWTGVFSLADAPGSATRCCLTFAPPISDFLCGRRDAAPVLPLACSSLDKCTAPSLQCARSRASISAAADACAASIAAASASAAALCDCMRCLALRLLALARRAACCFFCTCLTALAGSARGGAAGSPPSLLPCTLPGGSAALAAAAFDFPAHGLASQGPDSAHPSCYQSKRRSMSCAASVALCLCSDHQRPVRMRQVTVAPDDCGTAKDVMDGKPAQAPDRRPCGHNW